MNIIDAGLLDLIGVFLGFAFTVFIFSYIIGDNFFFRLATHIFIGVAAGYATVVTLYNVILPQLIFPFIDGNSGQKILATVFLIPSLLLLAKIFPRLSKLGNFTIAILVGIGAAAAVGGAVMGTIFPQTSASINVFGENEFLNAAIILIGTITTLVYFHFNTRRTTNRPALFSQFVQVLGWGGRVFIAITFGALFAGVYIAALTAFIERASFLWIFIKDVILGSI